jgi:hypothetical protein
VATTVARKHGRHDSLAVFVTTKDSQFAKCTQDVTSVRFVNPGGILLLLLDHKCGGRRRPTQRNTSPSAVLSGGLDAHGCLAAGQIWWTTKNNQSRLLSYQSMPPSLQLRPPRVAARPKSVSVTVGFCGQFYNAAGGLFPIIIGAR